MSLFNSVCYTIGWFWCVCFGIEGFTFLAFAGALFLIILQLLLTKRISKKDFIQDLLLLAFSLPFGILMEMVFIQTNTLHYVGHPSFLPPLYIICLYPLFTLIMNHSAAKFTTNKWMSFCFGLFYAPLSYFWGKKLGGITFSYESIPTWIITGSFWGFFLIFLRYLANSINKSVESAFDEESNNQNLTLYFDGECPICSREIAHLKKTSQNKINFINIADKEAFSKECNKCNKLSYETAMSQIHAQDEKGNLFLGLDALSKAYAKSNHYLSATLLNISFLRPLLNPLYRLFAKHRLFLTGKK